MKTVILIIAALVCSPVLGMSVPSLNPETQKEGEAHYGGFREMKTNTDDLIDEMRIDHNVGGDDYNEMLVAGIGIAFFVLVIMYIGAQ